MKLNIAIIIGCLMASTIVLGQTPISLKIVNLKSKPIVSGYINGKKAYFLLDTGSDLTIVNSADAKKYGFKLISSDRDKLVEGLGSSSTGIKRAANIHLKMNESRINTKFFAFDLTNIIRSLRLRTHIKIVGIIGSDVMKKYNFNIDYGKKLVHFQKQKPNNKVKNNQQEFTLSRN